MNECITAGTKLDKYLGPSSRVNTAHFTACAALVVTSEKICVVGSRTVEMVICGQVPGEKGCRWGEPAAQEADGRDVGGGRS